MAKHSSENMSKHTIIGQGEQGTVYLVLRDEERKAVKLHNDVIHSIVEIDTMTRFKHPNIMPIEGVLPGTTVMPCADMTLYDYVRKEQKSTTLVEIFYEIISAMEFLLKQALLPFDIHADNIVMMGKTPLLIDVAMVRKLNRRYDSNTYSEVPTGDSLIPIENLQGSEVYSEASIVWGLGSLAYTIFTRGRFMLDYEAKNLKGKENMKTWILKHLSLDKRKDTLDIAFSKSIPHQRLRELVVDLTAGMLNIDCKQRTSMKGILSHPLFTGYGKISECIPVTTALPLPSKEEIVSLAKAMLSDLEKVSDSEPPSNIFFAALYIYEALGKHISCSVLREICALTITYGCYFLNLVPHLVSHTKKLLEEGDEPRQILRSYTRMVWEIAGELVVSTQGSVIPMCSYEKCLERLTTLFPELKEASGVKEFLAQLAET